MSEQTPAEKLADAVAEFSKEIGDEGFVSSFVVGYQLTKIEDQPGYSPLTTSASYTTGPGTTLEGAIGLLRVTQLRFESIFIDSLGDEDDD